MVIIFDLGKVILDFDHRIITRRLVERSRASEQRIHEVIFGGDRESSYDRGKMKSREFYRDVVKSLGIDLPFREFRDIWTRIFTSNDDVCDIIRKLKSRYRLILLSNTNEMHFDYAFGMFDILKAFDDYVLSYRVGERKPHPKIYLTALQRASCPARACIYIDDMEPYASAARQLGMQAIVFRNAHQLERELAALNVVI
jgi:putative hydrolase of the HAD superfamily